MRSETPRRYFAYLLLAAGLALPAAPARTQERRPAPGPAEAVPAVRGECPRPIALTLKADPPSFVATDFNQAQLGAPHMTGLNATTGDKNFLHTFQWKRDERCCQVTRAVLTVKMKSIHGGQSATSSDAGNDGIAIMHAGAAVAPYNEAVYSAVPKPFGTGQPAVKTWNLTGAALNNINTSSQLSFAVQDDTGVESATLQLWGCCLAPPRREAAADLQAVPRQIEQ